MKVTELEQLQSRLQVEMSAFNGAWKTNSNRMIGATSPFPDEAFSSWCERLSLQFSVGREVILEHLGIQTPASWVDTGRVEIDVHKTAYQTGISPEKLLAFNAATSTLMREPEYSYLTASPLERRTTFRYCEQCLLEDKVPYGRRLWRLSFIHICPKHRSILRDKCPNCNKSIDDGYSAKKRTMSLRTCFSCNYNLGTVASKFLPEKEALTMLHRQSWWVKLLSALGSFQQSTGYWYGDFDPDGLIHRDFGQLRGKMNSYFFHFIFNSTGRFFFTSDERIVIRKRTLVDMFERNNPYFFRPSNFEYRGKLRQRIFIGGEYTALDNAQTIATALSECHALTLGGDLFYMRRNLAIPEDLTQEVGAAARISCRWVYPANLLPSRKISEAPSIPWSAILDLWREGSRETSPPYCP